MNIIYIDQQAHEVNPGHNLLEACLSLGLDLPYFCWHPAMGSVGACRQCAVKQFRDEKDTKGQLVMACMTPAASDTRISLDDAEARAFRAEVIEWLMINHPHDCPVCDEGGECHLQDMTVMTGHVARRYRGLKRTYRNQELGPFVNHEMNRCIQCYRCVRFYQNYAGGRDLNVFGSRDQLYFGRFEDGVLENEFSGNLVEVCPTGVFTDRPLSRHYIRKWDLQTAPSICVHCGIGCNTVIGERSGYLRRVLNRYNHEVNGYFLCDRGRFGYQFVNSEQRVHKPMVRSATTGRLEPVERAEALEAVSSCLGPTKRVIGIGSPRASLEANFALRCMVGPENFSSGIPSRESHLLKKIVTILRDGPVPSRMLQEVEQADAVLVLGEDLIHTAPRLALAIRQSLRRPALNHARSLGIPEWNDSAVRNATPGMAGPLYVLHWVNEGFQDLATATYRAAPEDLARIGMAIAHAIDPAAPSVAGLSSSEAHLVHRIARDLRQAKTPLIVSGTSACSEYGIDAAANIAFALAHDDREPGLCFVVPECNSLGACLMGGFPLEQALHMATGQPVEQAIDTAILLENDVYERAAEQEVTTFFERVPYVVAVDHSHHATSRRAAYVFPAGTFAETTGTLVNYESRAQQFCSVIPSDGKVQSSWRWIRDLAMEQDSSTPLRDWSTVQDVRSSLVSQLAAFHGLGSEDFLQSHQPDHLVVPRQPHRFSGRTALSAHLTMFEPQPPRDPDSPLAYSMEGFTPEQPSSYIIPAFWAPGWNSAQAVNKFQEEIGGPLHRSSAAFRLIQPSRENTWSYFAGIPESFQSRDGEWLILPLHQIFGGEELSAQSPPIQERAPSPVLLLRSEEVERLGCKDGDRIQLEVDGMRVNVPVRSQPEFPRGVAACSLIGDCRRLPLPAWGRVRRE